MWTVGEDIEAEGEGDKRGMEEGSQRGVRGKAVLRLGDVDRPTVIFHICGKKRGG